MFDNEPAINAEFFALQNTVVYPHVGSATHETRFAIQTLRDRAYVEYRSEER